MLGRAAVATLLLAAACSNPETTTPPTVSWTKVELPAGAEPVKLTVQGSNLLVGLRQRGAKVVPGLLVRSPDARLTAVPMRPESPYAFDAVWYSIVTDGDRILAVGGAPGGAHANTRWTVWTGTAKGLVEKPQSFNTFGGWGAGSVVDAVTTPAGQALLGSWGSEQAGLDVAVWLPRGDRWIRQSSARTPLESTRERQVGIRSATTSGAGIVAAGSQLDLTSGVRQSAVMWRSAGLNQGWERSDLPDSGDRGEAASVSCTPDACAIAGWVDGKLALWKDARRLSGVPEVAVGDKDVLPPPIQDGDRLVQVVGEAGQVRVVHGDGSSWKVQNATGPTGAVLDAALVGDSLYVIAGTALWHAPISR